MWAQMQSSPWLSYWTYHKLTKNCLVLSEKLSFRLQRMILQIGSLYMVNSRALASKH